jgi:hypothetical protein
MHTHDPQLIDYESILPHIYYDALAGHLFRRAPGARGLSGKPLGHRNGVGYLMIRIGGKKYFAHRVAWLAYHGTWPAGVIDHINGIKHDNRIENLRDVVPAVNAQNLHSIERRSISGLLGAIAQPDGTFRALIRVGKRRLDLGSFGTKEESHRAYIAAKRKLHPGNTF